MAPLPAPLEPHRFLTTPTGRVVIPGSRLCKETFEFLGFGAGEAARRWRVEDGLPDVQDRPELLSLVLDTLPDRLGLDYAEYFGYYCISRELQDAIMEPRFADIRGTAGPGYWVRDSVRSRYAVLEDYFGSRSGQSIAGSSRAVGAKVGPEKPFMPRDEEDDGDYQDEDDNDDDDGYVTLYKGLGAWRTAGLWQPKGLKPVSLDHVHASEPERGDFHRSKQLYLTPQRALAVAFAEYATHRGHGMGGGRLLTLQVPKSFLAGFQGATLWLDQPREAWKKVVRLCRYGLTTTTTTTTTTVTMIAAPRNHDRVPPSMLKLFAHSEFVVGHASTGHRGDVIRGPRRHVQLDETYVLHTHDGEGRRERAVLWMFRHDMLDSLEEVLGPEGEGRIELADVPCSVPRQERGDSLMTTTTTTTD